MFIIYRYYIRSVPRGDVKRARPPMPADPRRSWRPPNKYTNYI